MSKNAYQFYRGALICRSGPCRVDGEQFVSKFDF